MGLETECLKEVARLRKENKVLKEILKGYMESFGEEGTEYYCGIGLVSIDDVNKLIEECSKEGYGTTYVLSGKDDLKKKEFRDYVCFGSFLRDIAGLHQDRLPREERDYSVDRNIEKAIEYLKKNGFEVSVTW